MFPSIIICKESVKGLVIAVLREISSEVLFGVGLADHRILYGITELVSSVHGDNPIVVFGVGGGDNCVCKVSTVFLYGSYRNGVCAVTVLGDGVGVTKGCVLAVVEHNVENVVTCLPMSGESKFVILVRVGVLKRILNGVTVLFHTVNGKTPAGKAVLLNYDISIYKIEIVCINRSEHDVPHILACFNDIEVVVARTPGSVIHSIEAVVAIEILVDSEREEGNVIIAFHRVLDRIILGNLGSLGIIGSGRTALGERELNENAGTLSENNGAAKFGNCFKIRVNE